jgi:hypothetical protein
MHLTMAAALAGTVTPSNYIAHFAEDTHIGFFVGKGIDHAWLEFSST